MYRSQLNVIPCDYHIILYTYVFERELWVAVAAFRNISSTDFVLPTVNNVHLQIRFVALIQNVTSNSTGFSIIFQVMYTISEEM
jgi:hypothetical protein